VSFQVPESALKFGFVNEPVGTHGSRTIMLAEVRLLLAACPPSATNDDYRHSIREDNVLLKKTDATRRESLRRLREFYGLSRDVLLFRALRDLWDDDVEAQPLLALLCAAARDPILRATAELVLELPQGASVTPEMLVAAADKSLPNRYNPMTLANISRHTASSWQQSGHLQGRLHKVRVQAHSKPASVVYALFLGYLCDARGEALFHTFWSQLLDASAHTLHDQAFGASQRGWIDYRRAGEITEVGFSYLLRQERGDRLL
jgi:hypothetical protein